MSHNTATAMPAAERALRPTRSTAASTNPYDTASAVKKNSRVMKCAALITSIHKRMRVRLDALARIEHGSVAVEQVPHHSERDVGVVAEPGVGEKDVGEDRRRRTTRTRRRYCIGCGAVSRSRVGEWLAGIRRRCAAEGDVVPLLPRLNELLEAARAGPLRDPDVADDHARHRGRGSGPLRPTGAPMKA